MSDENNSAELAVKPSTDGAVEFSFTIDGRRFTARFEPQQVSNIVTGMLTAAAVALQDSGKALDPSIQELPLSTAVDSTHWFMGRSNVEGQHVVAVRAGEAIVGFIIAREKLRDLGRVIIASAWKASSDGGGAVGLGSLLKEFLADLSAWAGLVATAWKREFWRRRELLAAWISGRSFRLFRTVTFDPDIGLSDYDAVSKCIYCPATVYSERPGGRRHPMGAEHIIAEGLGGTLELPEASCQNCERITGALVESDVVGRTLKALRVHLKLRGKKKRPPPDTLPLQRTHPGEPEIDVPIPVGDYPIMFGMPIYGAPSLFAGGSGGGQMTVAFSLVLVSHDPVKLRTRYGVTSFATAYWDTHMLFRMLAKIGHAFATAEIAGKFKPALLDMILSGTTDAFNHIGGDPYRSGLPSKALHELALGYQRANGKDYVVARIRLFARHQGPVYYVVVGESLEGRIAKFKKVFSRRISSMLARCKIRAPHRPDFPKCIIPNNTGT